MLIITLLLIKLSYHLPVDIKVNLASITFTNGGSGSKGGGGMEDSADTHNPIIVSEKALLQRQREVLKQQDLALLDIEKGVNRLHEQVLTHIQTYIHTCMNKCVHTFARRSSSTRR